MTVNTPVVSKTNIPAAVDMQHKPTILRLQKL